MASLTCEDVMTRAPRTLRPDASLLEGIRAMKELDVGFLPVCEASDGRLMGVVTDRDIAMALSGDEKPSRLRVRDVMTRDVTTVRPEENVLEAAHAMERARVRRIPVTDREGRVEGVIAVADLARRAMSRGEVERELPSVIEEVSRPGPPA